MVLDAWAASPARFREDANAEEALAVGGYAGRALVELASNAVDAARAQGVPARIRIRLHGNELRVANTGAALSPSGVAALASLRASAKRDTTDSVGHFGVGFTAVLTWSRAPSVVSTTGGIRFDATDTAAAIGALGNDALDREVDARHGQVPVLRLPWPTDAAADPPPQGYASEVRLPLAPGPLAEVERLLADEAVAEDLFWSLSDLAEIDLPDRLARCGIDRDGLTVIFDGSAVRRYRTADRTGEIPAPLLADRPIEERGRSRWRITWALPVADPASDDAGGWDESVLIEPAGAAVGRTTIGAPTPTDEPLTLPARLIGTFPVDDTRRRLASGPLRDYLLEQAAGAYLDLIATTEAADRWALVPVAGFPAGQIDAALRAAVLARIAQTPLFLSAAGDHVTPAGAWMLPGLGAGGAALFGQAIPGLLPPVPRAAADVLRTLGVQTLTWSQASAALAGIEREPEFWWHVYEAVSTAERPPEPEDLADIPIPLTGGRRSMGARGCLLPSAVGPAGTGPDGTAAHRIDPQLARRAGEVIPALRIVDPAAAHPLLERLGARPADPDALLADPGLIGAIREMRGRLEDADPDPDDLDDLATVVLDLLAAGGRAARPWSTPIGNSLIGSASGDGGADAALLGELVLTDEDGQPWPAGELSVPGSALASVLGPDVDCPVVGAEWTDRYPADVLAAAGVRSGFAVLTVSNPPGEQVDLPDLDEWLDLGSNNVPGTAGLPGETFTVLADLDLVAADRWTRALELIAADPDARRALAPTATGLSYSGWWLSQHALINGRPPADWRLPGALELAGLYDPVPTELDPLFARAVGVRADLAGVAADDPEELLERLADPARVVPPGTVAALTAAVVAAVADVDDLDLPAGVRSITGDVIDAADACVLDQPWLAQVLPASRLVPGGDDPTLVGKVLDLPLASSVVTASVADLGDASAGESPGWVAAAQARLGRAAASVGLRSADLALTVSSALRVTVDGADPVAVRWWVRGDRYWVDGSAEAAGRAVAWAAGAWPARHRAVAAAVDDWIALSEDALS